MAKLISYPATYTVLFLFFFLFVSTEMAMAEAKIRERRGETWSEFCANSGNCNRHCRNWEGASHGACHAQFPGFACFCYFKC